MQLYILDKDPKKCCEKLIETFSDLYSFKMTVELSQLICSCGISDVYKKIPQGKKQQEFILSNPKWIFLYHKELIENVFLYLSNKIKIKKESIDNLLNINNDLKKYLEKIQLEGKSNYFIDNCILFKAPFRYNKNYSGSEFETDTILSIDQCIEEYRKYALYKKEVLFKKNKIK